ncbi:MAG: hypothetical protein ACON5H_00295 [Akkermansiaceae bacterium]
MRAYESTSYEFAKNHLSDLTMERGKWLQDGNELRTYRRLQELEELKEMVKEYESLEKEQSEE